MDAVMHAVPQLVVTPWREAFDSQRAAFAADMNPSRDVRLDRLSRLLEMTERIAPALVEALSADFGHRSAHVTRLADVMMVAAAIKHARRRLRRWTRTRRVPTGLAYLPGRSRLMPQPLGVVGIVAPWNYPYQLAIGPAIAAIAAGNRVMIKPSEAAPRFAELLENAVAQSFAPAEMTVITGDADVGRSFVTLPFDHLLFTGSTQVGRQVALAAAANLTPVTLELGGKSPAILNPDCDLSRAAKSLVLGKMFNAGQTCIAPDYVVVPRAMLGQFEQAMSRAALALYPAHAGHRDRTSIISERHRERLVALVEDARRHGARIVTLADQGVNDFPRHLPLTLVFDAHDRMRIMQEEIFGPLLPVLACESLDEALQYVNGRDRPLALYWFGADAAVRDKVLRGTLSGGVTINDCMWHVGQEELPFGGVGASGTGAYHGEAGFRTFSKDKPVFHQSRLSGVPLLYPPYGGVFEFMARVLRHVL
jgi:coniferyl-aldehyde dehydrogenase